MSRFQEARALPWYHEGQRVIVLGNVGPAGTVTVMRFKRHSYDHKRTWFSAVVEHYNRNNELYTARGDVSSHYFRAKLCLDNADNEVEVFPSTVAFKSLKWTGPSPRPNQSRVGGHIVIEKIVGSDIFELYSAPIALYQKRSLGERLLRKMNRTPDFNKDQFLSLLLRDLQLGCFLDPAVSDMFKLKDDMPDMLHREITGTAVAPAPAAARRPGQPAPELQTKELPAQRVTAAARDAAREMARESGNSTLVIDHKLVATAVAADPSVAVPRPSGRTRHKAVAAKRCASVATSAAKKAKAQSAQVQQLTAFVPPYSSMPFDWSSGDGGDSTRSNSSMSDAHGSDMEASLAGSMDNDAVDPYARADYTTATSDPFPAPSFVRSGSDSVSDEIMLLLNQVFPMHNGADMIGGFGLPLAQLHQQPIEPTISILEE